MKKGSILPKIKDALEQHLILISVVLGMFIALGLKLEFIKDTNFLGFVERPNGIMYLLITIGIMLLMHYTLKIKDKRLGGVSCLVGVIFAITYYLGDIQNDYIYTTVPTSKKFILYSIIKLVTYFGLFTSCVKILFNKLPLLATKFDSKKDWKFFTNNKKSYWIVALIFFISFIPFFLRYYPGNVQTDNMGSLYQVTGLKPYSNFQPILYTLIFGGLWNLGKAIFGTSTAGIAVYTIFQMICTSLVFSSIMYYLAKRKVSLKYRIATFLFLILNPLNGWFAVRSEKGMLFHLSLILVIIGIIDIIHEKERFFETKWKPILLGLITLIMVFLRNNGIYAIILTLPFLIFACKKIWKPITVLFGTTLITIFIIQGPIFKMLNVNYSSPGEALAVPMQQYARINKYASDRLSEEEKEIISRYFPVDSAKLANDYVPWFADPVKWTFSQEEFEKDKITFITQYFKFAFKFPVQTASALIMNTGNNYSPNFNSWSLLRDFGTETQEIYKTVGEGDKQRFNEFMTKYPIENKPIVDFGFLDFLNDELIKIPIFSNILINIGLYFWILILCFAYCIYKKQYKNMVVMLPILGLWATAIAAPMVDLRYIYPMFLTAPLYIGIIIRDCKIEEEEEKNGKAKRIKE